jgi:hypothetical protein
MKIPDYSPTISLLFSMMKSRVEYPGNSQILLYEIVSEAIKFTQRKLDKRQLAGK